MRQRVIFAFSASLTLLLAPASQAGDGETFGIKPFALTPTQPEEIPLAEKGLGDPLPASPGKVALAEEAKLSLLPLNEQTPKAGQLEELFLAVADGNIESTRALLDAGVDPNGILGHPVRPDLLDRFRGTLLHYFVTVERGLTPLMAAAALGQKETVELLLERGASPNLRTKRHGTNALWLAGYAGHADVMQVLLGVKPDSEAARTRIEIDLAAQTARIVRDDQPAEPVPISSGRKKFATPQGTFVVTDKHRHWRSTLYPADMPFFLRLSCRDFGLHAGALPGYPASHGCIRLRRQDALAFFNEVPIGTRVVIR